MYLRLSLGRVLLDKMGQIYNGRTILWGLTRKIYFPSSYAISIVLGVTNVQLGTGVIERVDSKENETSFFLSEYGNGLMAIQNQMTHHQRSPAIYSK